FGMVLYEMLTGRRAFDGASRASIVAAILDTQPPTISTIRPLTPAALDHLVKTCLAKDPDERWQSAGDVARQLRWIAEAGNSSDPSVRARTSTPRQRRALVAGAVVLLAAGALGGALIWSRFAREATHSSAAIRSIALVTDSTDSEFALSDDG